MLFLYAIQDLLDILFYTVDTLIFVYSSVLGCRTCQKVNISIWSIILFSKRVPQNLKIDLTFTTLTLMTLNLWITPHLSNLAEPNTTILGNKELFIEAGSTINLTCIIRVGAMSDTHIFWNYNGKVSSRIFYKRASHRIEWWEHYFPVRLQYVTCPLSAHKDHKDRIPHLYHFNLQIVCIDFIKFFNYLWWVHCCLVLQ